MDSQSIRSVIERTSNIDSSTRKNGITGKMMTTNFLKSTGVFDAYESVVSSMVEDGWPDDQSIFDHAAYLLLKWQTDHSDEIAISTATYKKSSIFSQNEGSSSAVQKFKDRETVEDLKKEIKRDSKSQIGGGAPKLIQLKSKKSYNFKQNKIEVSVFEGVPQRALTMKKSNEDYEKR